MPGHRVYGFHPAGRVQAIGLGEEGAGREMATPSIPLSAESPTPARPNRRIAALRHLGMPHALVSTTGRGHQPTHGHRRENASNGQKNKETRAIRVHPTPTLVLPAVGKGSGTDLSAFLFFEMW